MSVGAPQGLGLPGLCPGVTGSRTRSWYGATLVLSRMLSFSNNQGIVGLTGRSGPKVMSLQEALPLCLSVSVCGALERLSLQGVPQCCCGE